MLLPIKLFHKNSRLDNEKNAVFFKLNSDQNKSLMSVTFLEVMINRIDMRSVDSLVILFSNPSIHLVIIIGFIQKSQHLGSSA
jgi:hypothetical protein